VHPMDLKTATADSLVAILQDAREFLKE
jgi:hypothetical protein